VAARGYELDALQTISASVQLVGAAAQAKSADDELRGVGSLPAAAAGISISDEMAGFEAQWHEALTALVEEMHALAKNVKSTATMSITADEQVTDRFRRFSV
jgi:hypothetical protein